MNNKISFYYLIIVIASFAIAILGYETKITNLLGWLLLLLGVASGTVGLLSLVTYNKLTLYGTILQNVRMILPGLLLACLVSPLDYLYMPPILPRVHLMQDLGLILVVAGVVICFWTHCLIDWWDLGDQPVKTDHRLTREGFYQVMRYPDYTGLGLIILGFCMGFSSVLGLFSFLALIIPGITGRRFANPI